MTADPKPVHIAPLLDLIPTIPAEDTHLRHAARIALRNALTTDASQDQLVWMLKDAIASKEPRAKVLDDVFLGVPTAYAGWWLSERMRAGTLTPAIADRAAEQVARYGCDCHRLLAWEAALAAGSPRRQAAMLAGFNRGLAAAGVAFRPDVPAAHRQRVLDALKSANESDVRDALNLAGELRVDVAEIAARLLRDPARPEPTRLAAFAVLEKEAKDRLLPACGDLVRDDATPAGLRDKALGVFASSTKLPDQIALTDMLKTAPYRQGVVIAVGLAGTKEGADLLLAAVKAGQASPRLLQEPFVLARLKATNVRDLDGRLKELTAGIPSADARLLILLAQRANGFKAAKPDPAQGKALFTTHCANCHQIGGQGGKVGPNLDGVGNRGPDRLCEDVLDPNRNVDAAFRTTFLTLADGRTLSGLLLRQEGQVLVLADALGKEVRVSEADVERRTTSPLSPMPADWGEKLKPGEFYHLLAYLLEQRAK